MTLLWMDGFDAGDFAFRYHVPPNDAEAIGTVTRFNSGRSIGGIVYLTRSLVAGVTKAIVGAAHIRYTGSEGDRPLIGFATDGGNTQQLGIRYMNNGSLGLFRGGTSSGVQIAASVPNAMPASVWHYVEASATISDTVGEVHVRLNGVEVLSFTGDTQFGGTSTLIDTVGWANGFSQSGYFDDVYICDDTGSAPFNDFLGDVRVVTLTPTGPGSNTGLVPSAAPNWSCVDEIPYSATDYVSSATPGAKDTYATANLPAGTTDVYAVQLNTVAKKSDAGPRNLKNVVRSGGTDYSDGTAQVMASSDNSYRSLRLTDPATGASWTVAGVNAMEIGVEVG
jgi:hypothetical protein